MKKLSLNTKFIFILAIFVLGSLVISWAGIHTMNTLGGSLDFVIHNAGKKIIWARIIDANNNDIRNNEKLFILRENVEERNKLAASIDDLQKENLAIIDDYKKVASEAALKELENLQKLIDEWRPIDQEIRKLALAGKKAEAIALAVDKGEEIGGEFDKIIMGSIARNTNYLQQEEIRSGELMVSARNLIFGSSAVSLLFGLLLAFLVLRQVGATIHRVITNLSESSLQLTSAASQISSSAEQLSQGATEQAASLEETSAAIEQMNSMVNKNADTARQSAALSESSADSAQRGKQVVAEMQAAMIDINAASGNIMQQTTNSNQKISEIVKVIGEIGNKTKVINEIVFQTKLLSFNASVEAARAGEHGKGFAVVAEEVGNLAQMSGNAAKEITSMLESSIQKVESIVHDTKTAIERLVTESKNKVELGSRVAANCGEVLDEIVANVSQVTQLSQSISTATNEQARGIEEINKAASQLDKMTQQNAATSEETASAAEELSAQAVNMQGVVQELVHAIKGGGDQDDTSRKQTLTHAAVPKNYGTNQAQGHLLHLSSRRRSNTSSDGAMKLAASGYSIPSNDDARFKDV